MSSFSIKKNIEFSINNEVNDFCLCHFRDIEHQNPESPKHYYLNIPITDNSGLILCIITSQVDKRKKYYAGKKGDQLLKSLVEVDKTEISCLTKLSVIDCNQTELLTKEELIDRVDISTSYPFKVYPITLSEELKEKVINAIKSSPMVELYIKNLI